MLKETNSDRHKEPVRLSRGWVSRFSFLYIAGLLVAFTGLFLTLLPRLDFFLHQAQRWLPYPYFQTGSEGLIMNEVSIIRAGGSIYVPLRGDLFISAPYPPFYYYLLNWLWPAGSSGATGFTTGRAISLVAAIGAALAITGLVLAEIYRAGISRKKLPLTGLLPALSVGLLFLSLPAVAIWADRVRADMLMTFLGVLGLALLAWQPRGWLAFAAIIPLALALYTKQTALAPAAAAAVYFTLQNWSKWRRLIWWWLALAGAIGLPFVMLNLLTGLEFYRRLFKYHNLPWLPENFQTYRELFVGETLGLLLVCAGALILIAVLVVTGFRRDGPIKGLGQVPLAGWYLLFSLPLLLGMGVAGADHNHFLPAEAALCAGAGWLLARVLNAEKRWQVAGAIAGIGVMALLVWQAAVFSVPAPRYEIELRDRPQDDLALGRIIANTAANPSPNLLTSEAGFFVLANKQTTYNDLFTLFALSRQGLYDENTLLQRVRNKDFGIILAKYNFFSEDIRPDVWPPELVAAIRQSYYLKFKDVWFTYEPNP